MNNRIEAKLTDLSGMQKAIEEILKQAWERGRKYGQNEDRPQGEEWLDNFIKKYNESRDFQITDIRDREKLLDELRPKGEWLWVGFDNDRLKWSCNQCGRGVEIQENFCPQCGLRMKGGED